MKDPGLRPDLIRRHQRDRLRLEVPLAVQLAAVQQHLQEAGVVASRRDQARAAGFPAPRQCRIPDSGHPKTIDGKWLGNARPLRFIRDIVCGLGHAERIEQSLLLELKQRLPRGHLDDTAEHVGRMAVVPAHGGLVGERQRRDPVGEFGIVEIAGVQLGIGIEFLHHGFAEEAVGDARGMPQQIPDRDRALQRLELERMFSCLIGRIDADFRIRKGVNVFRHGIIEGRVCRRRPASSRQPR